MKLLLDLLRHHSETFQVLGEAPEDFQQRLLARQDERRDEAGDLQNV